MKPGDRVVVDDPGTAHHGREATVTLCWADEAVLLVLAVGNGVSPISVPASSLRRAEATP